MMSFSLFIRGSSKKMNAILATAASLALIATAAHAGVNGVYKTQSNDNGSYLTVDIMPCEDDASLTCGFIKGAFDKNDDTVEGYENIGRRMIWNMQNMGSGIFKDGRIWAPDNDKTYNSEMKLEGDILTVEGCILFICRGQDWTRVE